MDEYEWGHASVTFPDWVGTAQLDQKMTGPVNLYDLTGIDSDEWQIIGLDFGAGERGRHTPHVIAVPREEWGGSPPSDLDEVNAAKISIHNGIDPFDLLQQITHLLDMRFRLRVVKDSTITITQHLDEPPQD